MEPIEGRTDKGVLLPEDLEPRGCGFITELTMFNPVVVARLD